MSSKILTNLVLNHFLHLDQYMHELHTRINKKILNQHTLITAKAQHHYAII